MENIFNWIAFGFQHSNAAGFFKIGLLLCVVCLCLFAVLWIGLFVWAFIEDKKVREVLPLFLYMNDAHNTYHRCPYSQMYTYKSPEHPIKIRSLGNKSFYCNASYVVKCNGIPWYCLYGLIGCFFGGLAIGLLVDIVTCAPVISSIVITIVAAVLLARGVRRLQKKLKAHMEDLEAHKEKK